MGGLRGHSEWPRVRQKWAWPAVMLQEKLRVAIEP